MATSDELLRSITQPNPEGHIVVGGDRFIRVPDNLKRLAVQHDHNIETITFDCPRYWDNHDMSEMVVYIHYILPDGTPGAHVADRVWVDDLDDSIMHFDWTITNEMTQYKGNLTILICIKKTVVDPGAADADNPTPEEIIEEIHWNSELNRDFYISEGLECELNIAREYPDIVTQLLERMLVVEGAEADMRQMLSSAGTYASSAADSEKAATTTLTEITAKSDYIKNSYAPAIKGRVSGEVIRVDDVSPIEHQVRCWVHGKNLFKPVIPESSSGNGYTNFWQCTAVVEGDGKIVLTSTVGSTSGVAYCRVGSITLKKGRTYVCTRYDKVNTGSVLAWRKGTTLTAWNTNQVITPKEDLDVDIAVYMEDISAVGNTASIYLQIEEGSVATSYEPYFDTDGVSICACGKNLVSYPYADDKTATRAGVTYTYYDNGIVVAEGTSSGSYFNVVTSSSRKIYFKKGVTYHLSGVPKKTGLYYMYAKDASGTNFFDYGEGAAFTPTVSGYGAVTIVITDGAQISGVTFRPQIVVGNTPSDYEVYKEPKTNEGVDEYGIVIMNSISPNMTICPVEDNVIIEAEYNRDTTKMFESYVLTDNAKNEIANKVAQDMADILDALNEYADTLIEGG